MSLKESEILPLPLPQKGILYIAPPTGHTNFKIRTLLESSQAGFSQPRGDLFAFPFEIEQLKGFCKSVVEILNKKELHETAALVQDLGKTPSLSDILHTKPLDSLIARIEGDWLLEILQNKRLLTYFQPIVDCKTQKVFGYECLLRAKDHEGNLISPLKIFEVARVTDLLIQVDRAARLTAIKNAELNRIKQHLFINFLPLSIYDPYYCLRATVKAIHQSNFSPDSIVFEVVESDKIADVDHLINILNFYRQSGFKVALDDFGSGYSSLNLLTKIKPDIIKINMELIRDIDKDPYKAEIAERIIDMARKLGVTTVVEGVETPEQLRWTVDHDVDLVQGFLFARPDCPPPEPANIILTPNQGGISLP